MIKIQDVVVPTKGTGKYLSTRALTFDLTPTNGISLYWAIHTEKVSTDEEGVETKEPGGMILEGNLNMPQSAYEEWGLDDQYVIDWVANELKLTLL